MSKKIQKKQEPDDSTTKIFPFYRKKCDNSGIQPHPAIKQKILEVVDANKNFQKLHYWQQLGPVQVRCLTQGLFDIDYQHLKQLKLWKAKIGDEGVRGICKYMMRSNSIQILDILDNQITSLGCQFLGKALGSPDCKVQKLKLDDNPIKTEGLKNLAFGLAKNPTIHKLSVKYCGIDSQGARYIQQILANIKSKMRSLKLQGNPFGNEGIYQILRAINISGQSLQKVNIADVKMNLLQYNDPRIRKLYKRKLDPSILQGKKKKKKGKNAKTFELIDNQLDKIDLKMKQNQKLNKSPKIQSQSQLKLKIIQQKKTDRKQEQQQIGTKLQLPDDDQNDDLLQPIQQMQERIPLSLLQHPCATDNSFKTIEQKVVHELQKILKNNLLIFKYNINFNPMSDHVGQLVMDLVDFNKKIKEIELPNNVSYDIRDELDTILRKRNKKKGEKGGRGISKSPAKKKKK